MLHAKVLLTLSDFHKGMCWQLDIYFTIFKRKIFSFKLNTVNHSPKNLIYNPRKVVAVGMEGGEKWKRRKEHLFNSKLGKPRWNSQTPTLISKLHEMSLISNLNNQTSYDKNSFPLPVIPTNILSPFIKWHILIITSEKTCRT